MASKKLPPKLLVIVGPTASGKSGLAMKLAKDFNGEIISADSWQVYKGFDIGSAKPSKREQQQIKHHLLDVTEASIGFNAPKFKKLAEKAISDIQGRGKLPILVGGTGLYIDSVLYNFGFLPKTSPKERAKLDAMSLDRLLQLAESLRIDLSTIDIRNTRRVVRAIESKGKKPTKSALRPETVTIGLKLTQDKLRQQVEKRVDQMLNDGLEQEVKTLAKRYGWDNAPMKGIGYRQWEAYFEGTQSLEQTREKIIKATMDLAKRQKTWFKRNPHIKWFENAQSAYQYLSKNVGF